MQEMIGEECMRSKAALSEKAETIFKSIDTDNSGGLDVPELKACFGKAGVELTQAEARAMVSEADENGCVLALCEAAAGACLLLRATRTMLLCRCRRNGTLDLWEFKKLLDEEVKRWQAQQKSSVCAIL